jgi:hypothetical protein
VKRFQPLSFGNGTNAAAESKQPQLKQLKCLSCKKSILKGEKEASFRLLNLPENDADELADNFFCHLHDHNDHSDNEDLISSLNPLRTSGKKLRKSVLNGLTVLILNENHLALNSLQLDEAERLLKCSSCSHTVGYKGKLGCLGTILGRLMI